MSPHDLPTLIARTFMATRYERSMLTKNVWRARAASMLAMVLPALAASAVMLLVVREGRWPELPADEAVMVALPAAAKPALRLQAVKPVHRHRTVAAPHVRLERDADCVASRR